MTGILAVPFTPTDLTDNNKINFQIGAGPVLTAVVTVPAAPGYYNNTKAADDLASAAAAALTALDTETWTHSWSNGFLTLTRGGTPTSVTLRWADAVTSFEAVWLGLALDNTANQTVADSVFTATYQGDRIWLPDFQTHVRAKPRRDVQLAASQSRKLSSRELTSWHIRPIEFDNIPAARIFQSDADDADFIAAITGATAGDPNVALESLWDVMATRLPYRWTSDDTDLDTYVELQIDPDNGGEDFLKAMDEPYITQRGKTQYFRVRIPLMEYVS